MTTLASERIHIVADLLPAYCKRNYAPPLFGITIFFLKLLFCCNFTIFMQDNVQYKFLLLFINIVILFTTVIEC
jgi:hypothetical protein